ncbi:Uncharacterized protein dnm_050150 [Desulfonema magnum]|uniref:Uncharacterized protein n=1 Tax=Desulfonema magnum TaxID=45655 RepID=A0A975BNI5_9BACT|nr:Uncharacterized protein dnm_050150 [Desulfonema magnum]
MFSPETMSSRKAVHLAENPDASRPGALSCVIPSDQTFTGKK